MMAQSSASGSKTIPQSNTTRSLTEGFSVSEGKEFWGLPDCCTYTSHGVVCRNCNLIRVSQGETVMETEEDTAKTYKYDDIQKTGSTSRRKVKATMNVGSKAETSGRGRRGGRGTHQNRNAYIVPSFHEEIGPDLCSGSPLVAMNSPGESSTHGKYKNKNKNKNTV